ncbi:MAG: D-2-hydroxyacid dehydrogenase [Chthoniobacterales bacterium]|nr:D-2-hydroxyacid dehydrogenase [Chthoniobacterales bacterium]
MPTRPDIVALDEGRLLDGGLDWGDLPSLGHLTVHDHTPPGEVVARASAAQIVLTNKTPLTADTLASLPHLRFISVLATGYNVVETDAARARGIPVSNVPSYGTDSVAQHVFALILELCNRVGRHADMVAESHWANSGEWCAPCAPVVELHGLRLGLIGRGRIARRVAEIGRAFGMEVAMASTSHPSGGDGLAPLDKVTATSDIVSLHCQLNGDNRGMVDAAFLARMKPTAFLVNTARGALINEPDLATALAGGTIAGAALDVLSVEPPPADHPLFHAPNCLITPHMAWMGPAARKRLISITVGNVRAFLAGSPVNVVNA